MAINQIGSNNPATMQGLPHSTAAQKPSFGAYNSAQSSLVSLSQPQEEGLLEGVWSLVTWPFRALGSLWSWITGSSSSTSATGAAKGQKGTSDAAEDFIAVFKKDDEEFDSDKFKEAYAGLSSDEKKAYRTMLWVAGEFQVVESGNKDWATKLVTKKGDFVEDEVEYLRAAGGMFKSAARLDSLAARFDKLADEMIADLDNEDSDADFKKDAEKVMKDFNKLPKDVKQRVEALAEIFAPKLALYTKKERDAGNEEARGHALSFKGMAHAMKLLADNHFLAVGDGAVRGDLERMLRVVGQKGLDRSGNVAATEGDLVHEYNQMSSAARKVFAEALGYAIGKPAAGEQYLYGRLKVDNDKVVPEPQLAAVVLKGLVGFDGGDVPRELGRIKFEAREASYE
jgi:hypothetical protein